MFMIGEFVAKIEVTLMLQGVLVISGKEDLGIFVKAAKQYKNSIKEPLKQPYNKVSKIIIKK